MSLFEKEGARRRFPVIVMTGFLGSGKTTLINRLVQRPEMARSAILINEFGEVPLDQHFVQTSVGEVVVMANGCICCTLQGDLEGAIGRLFGAETADGPVRFERLIIETTGLADPAPIIETLYGNPMLARNFALRGVIATVDGVHGAGQLVDHAEAVNQVAIADRLLVTKPDLAGQAEIEALRERLAAINPGAPISIVRDGEIAPGALFHAAMPVDGGDASRLERWPGAGATGAGHRHHDIEAFAVIIEAPLEWRQFSRCLKDLRVRHGAALLRLKGLLNIAGESGPVALHGVHHVLHSPVRYDQWPDDDRRSRIVFITRGLTRETVEDCLAELRPVRDDGRSKVGRDEVRG